MHHLSFGIVFNAGLNAFQSNLLLELTFLKAFILIIEAYALQSEDNYK